MSGSIEVDGELWARAEAVMEAATAVVRRWNGWPESLKGKFGVLFCEEMDRLAAAMELKRKDDDGR